MFEGALMSKSSHDVETQIRAAFDQGALETAAARTLEAYGDEIFKFLLVRLSNVADAQEAFSMFSEDLWVGLPKFAWRSPAQRSGTLCIRSESACRSQPRAFGGWLLVGDGRAAAKRNAKLPADDG